jgi:hypothetical protein
MLIHSMAETSLSATQTLQYLYSDQKNKMAKAFTAPLTIDHNLTLSLDGVAVRLV